MSGSRSELGNMSELVSGKMEPSYEKLDQLYS